MASLKSGAGVFGLIAIALAVSTSGCHAKVQAKVAPAPPPAVEPAPAVAMQGDKIALPGELEFENASAAIKETPQSKEILSTLIDVMRKHPEITKLRIEGHTDDRGGVAYNKKLSLNRAEAVAARLAKEGVEKGRISTIGLGPTKPLVDNSTADNRRANRRTEFHVEEMNGKPADNAPTTRTTAATVPGPAAATPASTPATAPKAKTPEKVASKI